MTSLAPVSNETLAPQHSAQNHVRMLAWLSFLSFAALGLSSPYINLYFKTTGFTGTQIGFLVSFAALLELTLNPMVNMFADRLQKHRLLYQGQVLLLGAASLILGLSQLPFLLGTAFVLNGISARAGNEILSQLTLTRLDELKLHIFGRVRLWGSVGWAVTTFFSAWLISVGGYMLTFLAAASLRFIHLPFSLALPEHAHSKSKEEHERVRPRQGIVVLMISQFLFFAGLNAFSTFIWIYFKEGLGVAPEHIGIYAAIFAIVEILPMLFVDKLIKRWGAQKVLIIGMFAMSIEWIAYTFLPSVAWIPVLQFLRGFGFTMYTIAVTVLIPRISNPARVATNRALIMVTMPALAMLLTSPIMGWLYDNYGARSMFTVAMCLGLCASSYLLFNYRHISTEVPVPTAAN